ncbi:hypothetical protein [Spiroplasma ixodetis]|uniref:Uncharacterized protein n=1 Tax=Spiroplasma ixodetis TaxID=2141 RepID=A0ABN6T1K3_9MOLU|nr:hypothetical protein [Spiroplasma ixodetis]BDT02800.1 hypothetical protein SHM_04460 [Spiroplasma ixodetis]
MSVPFNQNLDNTERLVEAPEFIEFFKISKAFLPLCTIFKSYHINAEKSLSTNFSPHF